MLKQSILIVAAVLLATGCRSPLPGGSASTMEVRPAAEVTYNPLVKLEKSLIYFPSRFPHGDWQPKGLEFEDVWFESADGTQLHGWFVPHPAAKAVVLYCHGNGGNVAYCGEELRKLHDQIGVSVMCFDYRGYGRSEGTPSEEGVLADARAAHSWLARHTGRTENQIVLLGRSLGGAVAVDLAANDGAAGLVLESTFTRLSDVGHSAYPWLPVRSLMRSNFDSAAKIARYHGPLLQSHGTTDRLIPFEMGRQLHAAANEPKQFIEILGNHNDPQPTRYYKAFEEFVARLDPPRQ